MGHTVANGLKRCHTSVGKGLGYGGRGSRVRSHVGVNLLSHEVHGDRPIPAKPSAILTTGVQAPSSYQSMTRRYLRKPQTVNSTRKKKTSYFFCICSCEPCLDILSNIKLWTKMKMNAEILYQLEQKLLFILMRKDQRNN